MLPWGCLALNNSYGSNIRMNVTPQIGENYSEILVNLQYYKNDSTIYDFIMWSDVLEENRLSTDRDRWEIGKILKLN